MLIVAYANEKHGTNRFTGWLHDYVLYARRLRRNVHA